MSRSHPLQSETFGPKELYSIQECAYSLGLSRATLYKLMSEGRLEFIKVGTRRLVSQTARAKFLASLSLARWVEASTNLRWP